MGHESSGRVLKLGPGVSNVKVGDRVALHPYTYYGLGAKYSNHPAGLCFPLPEHVSDAEAAYNEPLVSWSSLNPFGIKPSW